MISYEIGFTQTPHCQHTVVCSMKLENGEELPPVFDATDCSLSIVTDDLLMAGTYEIRVVA